MRRYPFILLWLTIVAALTVSGCGNTAPKEALQEQNLSRNYVCDHVKKKDVEAMMETTFSYAEVGKHDFPNTRYCLYGNGPVSDVHLYYFTEPGSYDSAPMYEQTKPISGLGFEAKKVFVPSSGDIVQILGRTDAGVLSMVFTNGIKDQGEIYHNAIGLLAKLVKVFP